jgi:uncharacterized protein
MGMPRPFANYVKHGVTFEAACEVFNDAFAIEQMEDRRNYGEERWIILGMERDRLLLVACTMRGDRIRIISVRAADPYERREYHEQNAR